MPGSSIARFIRRFQSTLKVKVNVMISFTDGETKAQGDKVVCLRPPSRQKLVTVGFVMQGSWQQELSQQQEKFDSFDGFHLESHSQAELLSGNFMLMMS